MMGSARTGILVLMLLMTACARPPERAPQPATPPATGAAPAPGTTPSPTPAAQRCSVPEPAPRAGTTHLTIYLSCEEALRPVVRQVPETNEPLKGALLELLKGPTEAERQAGLTSFFSSQTAGMLNSVALNPGGKAVVNFRDFSRVIPNASSSAGSAQLLGQLQSTIFAVPGVKEAEFLFDGKCEPFWNWLQMGCQTVRPK